MSLAGGLLRPFHGGFHNPPGPVAVASSASASRMTAICVSGWPAGPSGAPYGKRTCSARGMPTFSAMSRFITTQTVGMPSASIALAISPTDCWQIGQHGVRKAACTPVGDQPPRHLRRGLVDQLKRFGQVAHEAVGPGMQRADHPLLDQLPENEPRAAPRSGRPQPARGRSASGRSEAINGGVDVDLAKRRVAGVVPRVKRQLRFRRSTARRC